MAKIEDLIDQIADERLKTAIGAEVRELKKNKKFGLVFEEHLPETVRLPNLPVKYGEMVTKKEEPGNELWRVKAVSKGIARLERAAQGDPLTSNNEISLAVAELVVVRNFGDPIYPALISVDRVTRGGPDKPWHMIINADNFHALQLLLYAYEGKVDAIYIDPPYNSGARDWKYNNDYVDGRDPWRHSKWLSMMQKRLKLAKRLLKPEDSVLIVTIDEKECVRLGLLLEQIFPGCTVQMVTIVINPKGTARYNEFSRVEEYAFFVFIGSAKLHSLGSDMLTNRDYSSESEVRWRGLARTGRKGLSSSLKNLEIEVSISL